MTAFRSTVGSLLLALWVGLASPCAFAQATGFDFDGAIKRALEQPAGPQTPGAGAAAAAIDPQIGAFRRNLRVTKEVEEVFLKGLQGINAGAATEMRAAFAGQDVIAAITPALETYGLRTDNVADALTAYIVAGWQGARSDTSDSDKSVVLALQSQVRAALAASPDFARTTDRDKQMTAEGALLQAMLFDALTEAAASDPKLKVKVAGDIRQGMIATLNLDPLAMELDRSGMRAAGARPTASTPASTARSAAPVVSAEPRRAGGYPTDTQLAAASDRIPASRRPVRMVVDGEGTFVGFPAAYVYKTFNRLFFPNGLGTICADMDPALVEPTREQLERLEDCSVFAWRKSGNAISYQTAEGWKAADASEAAEGFPRGERIAVDFGRVDAVGFSFGPAGGVASGVDTGSISDSTLVLTANGDIATGRFTSTVVSGANIGGGTTNQQGPVVGRYFLDGNLITIGLADGTIRHGYIGSVKENGRIAHIYLNGVQFWDRDD